jgi:hypothetical protein
MPAWLRDFLCGSLREMADDRKGSARGDLGLKSLEAKKLARQVGALRQLVMSMGMNLDAMSRNLAFGDQRTMVLDAHENAVMAVRGLATAEEFLTSVGRSLEGGPAPYHEYDRRAGTGEPWAPKVVAVGGVPIEEYARPSASKTADVDHDFKMKLDTLARNFKDDLADMKTAARTVGGLEGGEGVGRELLQLQGSMFNMTEMVEEEVGKFSEWVDGKMRRHEPGTRK